MVKRDEYRRFALLCLGLANTAPGLADRTHLLTMAEAWLDLADRAARQPARYKLPRSIIRWSEEHSARATPLETRHRLRRLSSGASRLARIRKSAPTVRSVGCLRPVEPPTGWSWRRPLC